MPMTVVLYILPGAGSFAPHVLLEDAGIEHELVRVLRDDAGKVVEPPDYADLNPSGRVPTLVWEDGTAQTESAAICLAIAERVGRPALLPPVGDAARRSALQRLVFLTNTVQVAILRARYPQRFVAGEEHQAAVIAHAHAELAVLRRRCAAWYDRTPFARGEEHGIEDVYLAMLIRWTRLTDVPWWDDPDLGTLFDRVMSLPAAVSALAHEGIPARPAAGS
jgi:glutathione S-transferase